MNILKIIFFIFFILFLQSCTIIKRHYRKGLYVTQNSSPAKNKSNKNDEINVKTNDSISQEVIKQKKTNSTIKDESDGFYYGLGVGLGNNNSIPITGEVNYRGFGIYGDFVTVSKAPYNSTGIFYDWLKKSDNNSFKTGISFKGNFRFSYEYLFLQKRTNCYFGCNLFFIPLSHFSGLDDIINRNPEKYTTIKEEFLSLHLVFGIKIL